MLRDSTMARIATAAVGVVVSSAAALSSTPAGAATTSVGRVDANHGLLGHYVPTAAAPRYGHYADGARIRIVCKVRSVSIGRNDRWYLVRGSARRWVSARYVDNVGAAPGRCGDGRRSRGRVTVAALNRREAPSLRAAKAGTLHRHDRVSIICWVDGLGEGPGDLQWYQLGNGTWVSAKHVGPTSRRVELCA